MRKEMNSLYSQVTSHDMITLMIKMQTNRVERHVNQEIFSETRKDLTIIYAQLDLFSFLIIIETITFCKLMYMCIYIRLLTYFYVIIFIVLLLI